MDINTISREIFGVIKKDGRIMPFNNEKIVNAAYQANLNVAEREANESGRTLTQSDQDELRRKAMEVGIKTTQNLYSKKQLGIFPNSKQNIPGVEDVHETVIETLDELGFTREARAYQSYHQQRLIDEQKLKVYRLSAGQNATDKSLFVISDSKEEELSFDRKRIAQALMKEAKLPDFKAYSVAKETERRIKIITDMRLQKVNDQIQPVKIRTSKIREIANEVMEDLGITERLRNTDVLTIPVYDYEQLLLGKNKENANVVANSPEMLSATIAEWNSREYMLNCIFSNRVAEAHLNGQIHLHDLGMGSRVYCSSHSPASIAKWGLRLDNLSTSSKPAKHTHTLTGHLNTFLASMQAYYAGALGVAYINDLFAPFIAADIERLKKDRLRFLDGVEKEMTENLKQIATNNDTTLEFVKKMDDFLNKMKKTFYDIREKDILTEEDIDKFLKQEAQYLIFSGSQMAFSRGGQTLFLDFNVHTGTPKHIRDNPAIGPGGKYHLRKNKELIPLREEIRTENNRQLSTLYLKERKVMEERFVKKGTKNELVRDYFLEEGEKIDTIGDYEKISKRFTKALLRVWDEGDGNGGIFPFPKCDLHVTQETFDDPEQHELLTYACEIASRNGSPYFIFDRQATTLSACCRLRTTIEDDYFLKKLESLRFCGMQNVTINSPQAAYRAGVGNRNKFIEMMKEGIELAIEAHLIKKDIIKRLGVEGGVQFQTQKPWMDGRPYVDLSEVTCIIGLLGWNDAYQFLMGKEFHEDPAIVAAAIDDLSVLYAYKEKRSKETGLNLKFEETPGESTCRRFAKIDLRKFPNEAKTVVKGSIERDEPYYTNSIHFRADSNVSITDRIKIQSMFHQLIEAGAILHAFVGEERPPAVSIFNLLKWIWDDTQCAQFTVSPEFTYCKSCNTITPGYHLKKHQDKLMQVKNI